MGDGKSEVLQGTLDLMVLKTLYAMGPQHGFGIARHALSKSVHCAGPDAISSEDPL